MYSSIFKNIIFYDLTSNVQQYHIVAFKKMFILMFIMIKNKLKFL